MRWLNRPLPPDQEENQHSDDHHQNAAKPNQFSRHTTSYCPSDEIGRFQADPLCPED